MRLQLTCNWTLGVTARRIGLAIGSYSGLLLTTVLAVVFCEQAYNASGNSVCARMRFFWSGAFRPSIGSQFTSWCMTGITGQSAAAPRDGSRFFGGVGGSDHAAESDDGAEEMGLTQER